MAPDQRLLPSVVAGLCVLVLTAACGTTQSARSPSAQANQPSASSRSVTTPSTPAVQATSPRAAGTPSRESTGRGRGDGSGRGGTAAAQSGLPADWPADVPVPSGVIQGSSGSVGRWSVLLLVAGPAPQVHAQAMSFYQAAGFSAASDSVLHRGRRTITVVVENADHSATETNLVVALTSG